MSAALSPNHYFSPVSCKEQVRVNVIIFPVEAHCNRHGNDYRSVPFQETFCVPQDYVSPFIGMHFPQVASAQSVSISIQETQTICFNAGFGGLCKLRNTTAYSCCRILGPHVLYGRTVVGAHVLQKDSLSQGSVNRWFWVGTSSVGVVAQRKPGITDVCFSCPSRNICPAQEDTAWWLFQLFLQ